MTHAYLIIAHHEPEIMRLLQKLDDLFNTIFSLSMPNIPVISLLSGGNCIIPISVS